jgi:hypothetical protein
MANTITRFYKGTRYIGIKNSRKDSMGEWRNELDVKAWFGRPYSRVGWDEIYEYTPELWAKYRAIADQQAIATNREVVDSGEYMYLVPIWIHRPISQCGLASGLLK